MYVSKLYLHKQMELNQYCDVVLFCIYLVLLQNITMKSQLHIPWRGLGPYTLV